MILKKKKMKRLRLFPRKKKNETFSYVDFEQARADNPLIKQLHIDQEKHKRTRHEMDEVFRMMRYCNDTVMRHSKDIPTEDFAEFMLSEQPGAYLPLSIRDFLGPFEGMIIIHNPYRGAKITEI